jgi:transcriptional regulator with XRE-family HTH domain
MEVSVPKDVLDWGAGNRYMRDLGGENHLAARIEAERRARGWSQSELARQMARIGHAIPQTAISKIEKPQRGSRRAISVDELIAFATVFDLPVGELVLPCRTHLALSAWRAILDGDKALQAKLQAEARYNALVSEVSRAAVKDADLLATLHEMRGRAAQAAGPPGHLPPSEQPSFVSDVFQTIDEATKSREQPNAH